MEPDELSIEERIDAMVARLDSAHEAIARGEQVDLADLDRDTNLLCMRLSERTPETRRYLPSLEALLDRLNGLEADLKRQFESA